MSMEDDLSRFCCQDPNCPDFGKRGHGNLTVCGHYGKTRPIRLLYCRTCKARFSERKGTPLYRSVLPQEKAIELIEHLAERTGVRATARLTGVNRNTVVRYSRLLGDHARQIHEELVAFSPSDV
jgi:transposase-like protein